MQLQQMRLRHGLDWGRGETFLTALRFMLRASRLGFRNRRALPTEGS